MLRVWLTAIATYGAWFHPLRRGGDARLDFHRRQAAGLYLLALAWAAAIFALLCIDLLLSRTVGGLLEGQAPTAGLSLPYAIIFGSLAAAGVAGLGLFALGVRNCAAGRERPLPVIGGLMLRRPRWFGPLRASSFVGLAIVVLAAITSAWGMNDPKPTVHFLYTLRDPIPEFLFRFSAVPLAWSARARGHGFFAGPLTADHVERAFAEGRFVILGGHGLEMGLPTDDGAWVGPVGPSGEQMEQLYFGACRIGASRPFWQQRFPRARIVAHDRLYHPMEGWFHLVFAAPGELATLADP